MTDQYTQAELLAALDRASTELQSYTGFRDVAAILRAHREQIAGGPFAHVPTGDPKKFDTPLYALNIKPESV